MKSLKHCNLLVAVAAVVFSFAASAEAASSGWINANDFERFSRNVLRKGNIPVSIACKNNDAVAGMDRRNTLLNIGYAPNTKNVAWRWAWGGAVGATDHKYKKEGYKMVSQGSFRRPSGLVIRCAIWHKTN